MLPGTVNLTASGLVGPSGSPIRVFFVELVSGGSASTCTLKNGTSGSGTTYSQVDGTASKAVTKGFVGGMLFPSGCYFSADGNISLASIGYTVGS